MSNIEWTDKTWNPVVGCSPVSPGCLNCYAATMAVRLEGMGRAEYAPREIPATMGTPYDSWEPGRTVRIAEVKSGRAVFTGSVRLVPERLVEPLSWKKPRRVFVCSMSDLFHADVPFEFIDRVFAVMALTPHVTYQVLTKRPERMAEYLSGATDRDTERRIMEVAFNVAPGNNISERADFVEPLCGRWPLPNVWLGTSAEDQERLDQRIGHLRRCPAVVRYLSLEPLLGPIHIDRSTGVQWVIVGGESGPRSRPCRVEWIRSIVANCWDIFVPVFVKQLGARPCVSTVEHGMANWGTAIDEVRDDTPVGTVPMRLRDRKGGDMAEWSENLQVREWPVGCGGVASAREKAQA